MNERGIISLTALCMMLVLSLSIAGVANMAARQADMVRYSRLENQLQNLAESYFNMKLAEISGNFAEYENMDFDTTPKIYSVKINESSTQIIEAKVTIYMKKSKPHEVIVIMALAELPNYIHGKYSAYRSVAGYVSVKKSEDNGDKYEFDKFKGYLY